MRRISPTNSRPAEDLELRARYAEANPGCELTEVMRKAGVVLRDGWQPGADAAETHHIFHLGARWDLWGNLIRIRGDLHAAGHNRSEAEIRILCLFAKWKKGELIIGELNQAAGAVRCDAEPVLCWLERTKVANVVVDAMREQLIEVLSV